VIVKKKLLVGAAIILGIAAAAFQIVSLAIALLVVWGYLTWMIWKKKVKLAEKHLKRLKALLLGAGISFVVAIVGVIMHNALYAMNEIEEHAWFIVAIVALYVFVGATIGGAVIFLKGRRKTTQRNTEISTI
jgi:nitrate reductase gamma subunit